ncbi:LMBR1 domain-containing protein-like protein [Lachnellula occidentalis]|uniref:LMBR1 domain-containing protein-like protein n=1 Tax=Lachnellula occidentalis TaxID=215460 RepID=A0A8H8RRF5_9HELO|nr:LMBR1 domain-containing protein-like protein [Lachnellula occidentalis]
MIANPSALGSEAFSLIALLVISLAVLLLLRHFLPLRTTPAYLTVPIFFALGIPASIILLVPIDLASSSRGDDASRGIWLPDRVLLVAWRISYWLTFGLTWYEYLLERLHSLSSLSLKNMPMLGTEIRRGGCCTLCAHAKYQGALFGSGLLGMIYFFISAGVRPASLKGLVMALGYCWGLILGIYLMGHGLVAIPRRLFRNASISGRLKRIQTEAAKVHEKMEEAIQNLEDLEAQVAQLSQRKTGSAKDFKDWIEELADESHLPESRPRTLSRRLSAPQVNVPNVITERYLADLSRQLDRARHTRARYLDEWDRILQDSVNTQAILDSAGSKRIEIGQASPNASILDRLTILTPFTRYLYRYHFIPYLRMFFGFFFSLASFCIIWSEVTKPINQYFSIISVTVVHHAEGQQGRIGFAGQVIAACWILYMCAAALISLTEVKVWRGRALVRRNTHGESAMWYAMQVAKLTVPLSFNFLTFISPESLYKETTFFKFLGQYITLTPLGTWFDWLFPMFILVPVCATLFNLYSKVASCAGYGNVIEDEDEDNENGYGTGSWREGRDLIERELQGASSLGRLEHATDRRSHVPNNPNNRTAPALTVPPAERHRALGQASASRPSADPQQQASTAPEDENFFEAFGHRVRNTVDTLDMPKWMQNMKRPKWMGGDDDGDGGGGGDDDAGPSRNGSWFGRQDGRVRL